MRRAWLCEDQPRRRRPPRRPFPVPTRRLPLRRRQPHLALRPFPGRLEAEELGLARVLLRVVAGALGQVRGQDGPLNAKEGGPSHSATRQGSRDNKRAREAQDACQGGRASGEGVRTARLVATKPGWHTLVVIAERGGMIHPTSAKQLSAFRHSDSFPSKLAAQVRPTHPLVYAQWSSEISRVDCSAARAKKNNSENQRRPRTAPFPPRELLREEHVAELRGAVRAPRLVGPPLPEQVRQVQLRTDGRTDIRGLDSAEQQRERR